jgi:2-phosphosulfolactate phosphatase
VNPAWRQAGYDLRFEWGPAGAAAVAPGAAVVVVVDVLSFTTTLALAVERGIAVMPYPWRDAAERDAAVARSAMSPGPGREAAEHGAAVGRPTTSPGTWRDAGEVAAEQGAVVAVGRSQAGPGEISLSPQTLVDPPVGVRRLVLPSPNGSAISVALAATGATVVGASLRNARAAAGWVERAAGGRPVAVIAAGERWPDGSLRPAVEDLWGAGAVIDALAGTRSISAEATVARTAYASVAGSLSDALPRTGSGVELDRSGFGGDVRLAMEESVSDAVPVLRDGWFVDGGSGRAEQLG